MAKPSTNGVLCADQEHPGAGKVARPPPSYTSPAGSPPRASTIDPVCAAIRSLTSAELKLAVSK